MRHWLSHQHSARIHAMNIEQSLVLESSKNAGARILARKFARERSRDVAQENAAASPLQTWWAADTAASLQTWWAADTAVHKH
jgi:hypothetical protein